MTTQTANLILKDCQMQNSKSFQRLNSKATQMQISKCEQMKSSRKDADDEDSIKDTMSVLIQKLLRENTNLKKEENPLSQRGMQLW